MEPLAHLTAAPTPTPIASVMIEGMIEGMTEGMSEGMTEVTHAFDRDGYAALPGRLDRGLVDLLRTQVDACMAQPLSPVNLERVLGAEVLRFCWQLHPLFREFLDHPLVTQAASAVLGPDVRVTGMSCIRTAPGAAIDAWHVDDVVEWPVGDDHPGHAANTLLPSLLVGIQIPLTDITSIDHGPTQLVPGSHRSGRMPDLNLSFRGQGPVAILARAGHLYLQNFQCWHRGMPNLSQCTRYLFQIIVSPGWLVRRCEQVRLHPVPLADRAGTGPAARRVLGYADQLSPEH